MTSELDRFIFVRVLSLQKNYKYPAPSKIVHQKSSSRENDEMRSRIVVGNFTGFSRRGTCATVYKGPRCGGWRGSGDGMDRRPGRGCAHDLFCARPFLPASELTAASDGGGDTLAARDWHERRTFAKLN